MLLYFWDFPGESCQTTEGNKRGGPGPGAQTWLWSMWGHSLGIWSWDPRVRCDSWVAQLCYTEMATVRGSPRWLGSFISGLHPRGLGLTAQFHSVINSGAWHVNGREANSEQPTW